MTQRQTQSQASQSQSSQSQSSQQSQSQGSSLSRPSSPDATSPYKGPADEAAPAKKQDSLEDSAAAEAAAAAEMQQPHFSEAQSTLSAFAPVERPGDHFAEPEDPQARVLASRPAEQPSSAHDGAHGTAFATSAGTVRAGMSVVDSYGHTIGVVAAVEGERLRLASTDPHDDGAAFLPVGLIDGIDGERVLLGGRGDASFGMSQE